LPRLRIFKQKICIYPPRPFLTSSNLLQLFYTKGEKLDKPLPYYMTFPNIAIRNLAVASISGDVSNLRTKSFIARLNLLT